jgi:hypothetical protein
MARSLDTLKTVKERLDHNYTSYQLLTVLDKLLWKALWPIVCNTEFIDRVLANVLGWSSSNPRRKLSSLPKERFTTYVVAYLAADDPRTKFRVLKRMRLERNILFHVLDRFNRLCDSYPRTTTPPPSIINSVRATQPNRLWFASRESCYWHQQASDFKSMIVEKYMRFVMMEAQSFYQQQRQHNPHLTFDLDDIAQNFILTVSKAIDKCDAQQGTLTSYIQNWIKDAKGNPSLRGEYGIAYTIPASQRRSIALSEKDKTVNISISLACEDLNELESVSNTEQEYERQQLTDTIRLLAKRADPLGISRMFLGVQEILDPNELHQFTTNQLTRSSNESAVQDQ